MVGGDYGLDIINKGLKNKNQEQNEQGSLLIRWIPNLEKYVSYFSPLHHQPAVIFETGPLPVPVNQGSLNKCGTTHQRKVPTTTSVNKNVVDFIRLFNVYIVGSFLDDKEKTDFVGRASIKVFWQRNVDRRRQDSMRVKMHNVAMQSSQSVVETE